MVKIINGKKYNTATAEAVGEWSNGRGACDFSNCTETLYKKRTGEFFLHGEGGPMTAYSEYINTNNWTGGEKIIPMTFEEARRWAEEHLEADEYEAVFGEVSEDEGTKGVMYSLPVSSIDKVKRVAIKRRITASQVINDLIGTL